MAAAVKAVTTAITVDKERQTMTATTVTTTTKTVTATKSLRGKKLTDAENRYLAGSKPLPAAETASLPPTRPDLVTDKLATPLTKPDFEDTVRSALNTGALTTDYFKSTASPLSPHSPIIAAKFTATELFPTAPKLTTNESYSTAAKLMAIEPYSTAAKFMATGPNSTARLSQDSTDLLRNPRRDSGMASSLESSGRVQQGHESLSTASTKVPSPTDPATFPATVPALPKEQNRPATTGSAVPANYVNFSRKSLSSVSSAESVTASPTPKGSILRLGSRRRNRSGSGSKGSNKIVKKSAPSPDDIAVLPQRPATSSAVENEWFKGLESVIPTGAMEDPFSLETTQFSKRGSMLIKGKKPEIVLAYNKNQSKSVGTPYTGAYTGAAAAPAAATQSPRGSPNNAFLAPLQVNQPRSSSSNFEDGNMSPEDRRLSKKVRSLYEDQTTAKEDLSKAGQSWLDLDRPESRLSERLHDVLEEDESSLTSTAQSRTVGENGTSAYRTLVPTSSRGSLRYQYVQEAAGGLEDWTNVQGEDVDRFGFIKPKSGTSSKRSSMPSLPLPLAGAASTATAEHSRANAAPPPATFTALEVLDEVPTPITPAAAAAALNALNKLNIDKNEPLPTPSQSNETTPPLNPNKKSQRLSAPASAAPSPRRPASSVLSFRSKTSRSSSLRSTRSTRTRKPYNKGARWLDEAGDMLAMPVGLGDIGLDEGTSSVEVRARQELEVKRSAKWAKMAIPVPQLPPIMRETESAANNKEKNPQVSLGGGAAYTFDTTSPKLISRVWKGIPDRWRAVAWHAFLTASAARRSPTGKPIPSDDALVRRFYQLQMLDCAEDPQIDMDVPRTIGSHIMFRRRYRGGQRLLFRLLRALTLQYPRVGYVQGMAPIAATLLCYFEEEKAFVIGCRMWELRGVGWLYAGPGATARSSSLSTPVNDQAAHEFTATARTTGFDGLMTALAEFDKDWINGTAVGDTMTDLMIVPTSFGTKWYLTLFSFSIPFRAMLRVWDVFMLLGDPPTSSLTRPLPVLGNTPQNTPISPQMQAAQHEDEDSAAPVDLSILHATGSALIHSLADVLIGADFENAMRALTTTIPVDREDVLMRVAKREWEERYLKKLDSSLQARKKRNRVSVVPAPVAHTATTPATGSNNSNNNKAVPTISAPINMNMNSGKPVTSTT